MIFSQRRGTFFAAIAALALLVASTGAYPQSSKEAEEQAAAAQKAAEQAAAKKAAAAAQQRAAVLEKILQQTRALKAAEAKLAQQREAEFKKQLEEAEQKLRNALAERNAAEAKGNALSKAWDDNVIRIENLRTLLKQHEGNLGELFGVTRQVAGDAAGVLLDSLITTQLSVPEGQEDREAFARRIASAKALPSISELERLWFELQREMTESAKSVRYEATVVDTAGAKSTKNVVRIGPFTAMTDSGYLHYLPSQKALTLYPRQPPSEFMDLARDFQRATSGYAQATVDPARGALLSLYVERPDVMERIKKGEIVGYIIISVGVLGALVWLFQLVYLVMTRLAVSWQLSHLDRPTANNPLGRVLLAVRSDGKKPEEAPEVLEMRISEAVLREVPRLERFQAFLRLVVSAGPLLGLIGTVVGMIITFKAITASGSNDPKLMANGIGQAMIATVLGLGIAIPLLFANASLASLSRRLVQILDEQSTGLLAEGTGKRRA